MRTRDEETKPPNRNSLIFHCHTEYSTVYRARAHEFTRDQNKEKHDTPEKAASTCKPASTGKERPSRRSGKPKLARRAAVKEGEPSRPLYPLSLSHAAFPTLSLSLSLPFSRPHLSFSLSRRFSLSLPSLFLAIPFLYLPGVLLPSTDPGFPFTRNPFLSARCSTADDNPFSTNDLLHSPANPVPFPAESL